MLLSLLLLLMITSPGKQRKIKNSAWVLASAGLQAPAPPSASGAGHVSRQFAPL